MSVKGIDIEARWFAGKGRDVAAVAAVGGAGGLALLEVGYADGGRERYLDIPAGFDWGALLRALRAAPCPGPGGGRLELRPGPALAGLLPAVGDAAREPSTDQSNTMVVLGERLLIKAYRRLEAGPHPEVELLGALAGRDAPVPPFAGSLHWVPSDGSPESAIALLQAFVPGLEDGWEAPIERIAAALRAGPPYPTAEWEAAGRAAARVDAALAAAFGLTPGTRADLERWRSDAESALTEAAPRDPELASKAPEIRARLARLTTLTPPQLSRIHGDIHVGQLLRVNEHKGSDPLGSDPLVIDFEGDPTRALADRLRPDTPLRDLAGLLRCVDHVASAGSRRAGWADPTAWIAGARAAVLAGYAEHSPVPIDPELLSVLELAKECSEYVYALRVAPEWLYAPQHAMRRLLEVEG
jgi:maltokinase